MKLCIRAHDLGAKGTDAILDRLDRLGIDGVQMVCYKAYEDIPYAPGAITAEKAAQIGEAFRNAGKIIPLVGAYFNPVHSDGNKVLRCREIFADYLKVCRFMGCDAVGSETGSFNDDQWTYHPQNRTREALDRVGDIFAGLCDEAKKWGSTVAMEGAAGHVCWSVEALAQTRARMGRETKVIFDLYNYLDQTNQDVYMDILEEGLNTFRGQILLFHMKDFFFQPGQRPRQAPFGAGQMDIPAVLGRIKAYDPNAVLTLEGTTGEDIPRAVDTIKTIWERV